MVEQKGKDLIQRKYLIHEFSFYNLHLIGLVEILTKFYIFGAMTFRITTFSITTLDKTIK
jgi:hypothetical protein